MKQLAMEETGLIAGGYNGPAHVAFQDAQYAPAPASDWGDGGGESGGGWGPGNIDCEGVCGSGGQIDAVLDRVEVRPSGCDAAFIGASSGAGVQIGGALGGLGGAIVGGLIGTIAGPEGTFVGGHLGRIAGTAAGRAYGQSAGRSLGRVGASYICYQ